MISIRILYIGIALTLMLAPKSGRAQVQTYYYSGPINGFIDAELTPGGDGQGGISVSLATLDETLSYDPVALTLEEAGIISLSGYTGTFNITSFGFPPPVVGSATLVVGNDGLISFDEMSSGYGNSFLIGPILFPVSGSGIYDGQAFAATWTIEVPTLETQISASSPTALTFNEFIYPAGFEQVPGDEVIDYLTSGDDDGTYGVSWNQQSIVATAVPEPSSLPLIGVGLSIIAYWRRCLRRSSPDGLCSRPSG